MIFGICGGYQMLGELLSDPEQVEEGGDLRGLGLLPMETVFVQEKTRTRVTGTFGKLTGALAGLTGMELEGYEIHMGRTKSSVSPAEEGTDGTMAYLCMQSDTDSVRKPDGCNRENVYGTYVHGVFDGEGISSALVKILAERKGISLEVAGQINRFQYKEQQYDLLADTLRRHLDMNKIYEILERGI